jgi:hypothetical protein
MKGRIRRCLGRMVLIAGERGLAAARESIRQRLEYELAYPRGGLISTVPTLRSIFARWRHLTLEVGRLCGEYARFTQRHLMDVYVDCHRPTWPLAWNMETMWRNETAFRSPQLRRKSSRPGH